jgi:ATP-dependent RNA helicase SUPV3L1/SUV3
VRFGAFNVYVPALLKPAAADLLLLLWALFAGRDHGLDVEALPARPQQGLTSVAAADGIPEPYWRAAGFHVAGGRAIRIDMLERLSDLIRARISFRRTEGGPEAPAGASGDGGFRVVPELMSVVGCSGEEFASILKALGFRRERRKIAPAAPSAATISAPEGQASGEQAAEAVESPIELFDEVWRPGKRRDMAHTKRAAHKLKRQPRERGGAAKREQRRPAARGKPERTKPVEHSPFAALAVLKGRLTVRQPEGS